MTEQETFTDPIRLKLKHAMEKINCQMDAHLIESIISLFNQGVLKHYVRTPKQTIDPENYNMTIDAANGVRFEGREKLVEMEQKINNLTEQNKILQKQLAERELELIGKEPLYSRRKLQKQNKILIEAVDILDELADLMDGVINGEYKPDSFTLQPYRLYRRKIEELKEGQLPHIKETKND